MKLTNTYDKLARLSALRRGAANIESFMAESLIPDPRDSDKLNAILAEIVAVKRSLGVAQ